MLFVVVVDGFDWFDIIVSIGRNVVSSFDTKFSGDFNESETFDFKLTF